MGNSGQRSEQSRTARIDNQHSQHGAPTAIVVKTVFLGSTGVWVLNGWDADRWVAGRPALAPLRNGIESKFGSLAAI